MGREALYTPEGDAGGAPDLGGLFRGVRQIHRHGLCQARPRGRGHKAAVRMFDRLWDATVTCDSPYDPKNETIRKDG